MIKTIEGHLTATDKRNINALLNQNLTAGKIGKKTYFLSKDNDIFMVKQQVKDRGLVPCPGSQLRISTYIAKFTIK